MTHPTHSQQLSTHLQAVPSLPSAFLCLPYTSTETPADLSADWEYNGSNERGVPTRTPPKHTDSVKVLSHPSVPVSMLL